MCVIALAAFAVRAHVPISGREAYDLAKQYIIKAWPNEAPLINEQEIEVVDADKMWCVIFGDGTGSSTDILVKKNGEILGVQFSCGIREPVSDAITAIQKQGGTLR